MTRTESLFGETINDFCNKIGTWRLSLRCTKFRRDRRYCGHWTGPRPRSPSTKMTHNRHIVLEIRELYAWPVAAMDRILEDVHRDSPRNHALRDSKHHRLRQDSPADPALEGSFHDQTDPHAQGIAQILLKARNSMRPMPSPKPTNISKSLPSVCSPRTYEPKTPISRIQYRRRKSGCIRLNFPTISSSVFIVGR
jgi:hypothetical protein